MKTADGTHWSFAPRFSDMPRPIITKIQGFAQLPKGWHYGEGRPADEATVNNATAIAKEARHLNFKEMDAFPGVSGEVVVVIYSGDEDLEFTLFQNGRVTFSHESGCLEIDYQENLSLVDAIEKLRSFRKSRCRQSDSFTSTTMTTSVGVLEARHSRIPVRILPEYQSSAQNAFPEAEVQSVNTLPFFILVSQVKVIPPFSGSSPRRSYQTVIR